MDGASTSVLDSLLSPATVIDLDESAAPSEDVEKQSPALFTACVVCRRAHTACDEGRPCKRCIKLNKADQCRNPLPKKRGRPKRGNEGGTSSKKQKTCDSSDGSSSTDSTSPPQSFDQGSPLLQVLGEIKRLHEGQQRLESTVLQLQQENQMYKMNQRPMNEFSTDTTTMLTKTNIRSVSTLADRFNFPSPEIIDDTKPFAFIESCRFVFANSLFCKLFEYSLEELKTIVTRSLIHPAEIPATQTKILNHLLRSAKTVDFPAMTFRTKSGRTFLATSRNQLFYNGKDIPTFTMIQITDILGMGLSRFPTATEITQLPTPSESSIDATYQHIPKLWKMLEWFKEKQAMEQPGAGCHDLDGMINLIYRKIDALYREHNAQIPPQPLPFTATPLGGIERLSPIHNNSVEKGREDSNGSRWNVWDDLMNLESLLVPSPSASIQM